MAKVSTLARALREVAERAIVHARPPGPLKPQARPLSYHHSAQAPVQHQTTPIFQKALPTTATPAAQTLSSARDALRMIFDHAISPVFIGLRAPRSAHVDKVYKSSSQSEFFSKSANYRQYGANFYRGPMRSHVSGNAPQSQIVRAVREVKSNFTGNAQLISTPSLGLRAAVDELDEKLRGLDRSEKGKQREVRCRRSFVDDHVAGPKRKYWNIAQYVKELDDAYTPSPTISVISLLDDISDFDLSSCSSSTIEDLEEQRLYQLAIRDGGTWDRLLSTSEASRATDNLEEERVFFETVLEIPLEPRYPSEETDELLGSTEDGSSSLLEGMMERSEAYQKHKLQVIEVLDHAVHSGQLSKLRPVGWNNGKAYSRVIQAGRRRIAVLPLTFFNCHADQVLEAMHHDLTPRLYALLKNSVHDYKVDRYGQPITTKQELERSEGLVGKIDDTDPCNEHLQFPSSPNQ